MNPLEKAVRDAAASLHAAIAAARAAGLRVDYPTSFDALPGIAISETAKSQKLADDAKAKAAKK